MDRLSIDLDLNHNGSREPSSLIFDFLGHTFDSEHTLQINHMFLITTFLDLRLLTRDPSLGARGPETSDYMLRTLRALVE